MNKKNSKILLARSLRLSTIQQLYDNELLTEGDARELLAGPLEPGDDSTIVNDSDQLTVKTEDKQ